jgi:hypothetical protein
LSTSVSDLTTSLSEKKAHIESSTASYTAQIAHLKEDVARLTREREEYIQKLGMEHQEELSILKDGLKKDVSLYLFVSTLTGQYEEKERQYLDEIKELQDQIGTLEKTHSIEMKTLSSQVCCSNFLADSKISVSRSFGYLRAKARERP